MGNFLFLKKSRRLSFLSLISLFLLACSDVSLEEQSTLEQVNSALSVQNCQSAFQIISPLYQSTATNNSIRLAMADTYGCFAGVNLLDILNSLVSSSGSLSGSSFWGFLASLFPSSTTPVDDKKPEAAQDGINALLSAINPGVFVLPSDQINSDINNPRSLQMGDRISDSNAYLAFLSMALVGSLSSRYGVPLPNSYHRSVDLPWTTANLVNEDGCRFASGILNFYDGITYLASSAPATTRAAFEEIQQYLGPGADTACAYGCQVLCGGAVSCSSCPRSLRESTSCTGAPTDVHSCAAAGLVSFVNTSWQKGP